MGRMFALVDCNNFFVSCERLFRPDLATKPVITMSSNDGCVIARSNETKQLGIPMGAPIFKYKSIIEAENITLFSANFRLYGDISKRLTELLQAKIPRIEIYSIDESFLDISSLAIKDIESWAQSLQATIKQAIGIPVSIGIGPTKTLAKLASEQAKLNTDINISMLHKNDPKLANIKVEDIWGVGRKHAPKLRVAGLATAADIANTDPTTLRNIFGSVHGERLQRELSGTVCLEIEPQTKPQKMISSTRTFGHDISQTYELEAAIANLAAKAAYNLRRDNQLARKIKIFASTNYRNSAYASHSKSYTFTHPTCHTGQIIEAANKIIRDVSVSSTRYHRAGVILYELVSAKSSTQRHFFEQESIDRQNQRNKSMQGVDTINAKYGLNTIHFASEDLSTKWQPKRARISPNYTSSWEDLPKIY